VQLHFPLALNVLLALAQQDSESFTHLFSVVPLTSSHEGIQWHILFYYSSVRRLERLVFRRAERIFINHKNPIIMKDNMKNQEQQQERTTQQQPGQQRTEQGQERQKTSTPNQPDRREDLDLHKNPEKNKEQSDRSQQDRPREENQRGGSNLK